LVKGINYTKAILNILKATNKMNPIQETTVNEYIREIKFNAEVILHAVDLGPPPQMVRTPPNNAYEDFPLILDGALPNDFAMPEPCGNCYTFSCNGDCDEEKLENSHQPLTRVLTNVAYYYYKPGEELKEEESDMDLPPPPPFTRMYTNAHLPPDELEDYSEDESDEFDMPEGIQYVSISRINTNADEPENQLLVALSEAESNIRDEYEEAFFKEVENKKQDQDQDQKQDQDK
jgi:hypothetical protein